jgi:hypothetical protein
MMRMKIIVGSKRSRRIKTERIKMIRRRKKEPDENKGVRGFNVKDE